MSQTPTPSNPCQDCEGQCCQELAVTVAIPDIARIHRYLHVPVHDFLARYVDEDPKEEPYAFIIRREPIALALLPPGDSDRGCSFLMDIGGHLRCGIYDIRPGTCKVYPFTTEGRVVKHKPDTLCPRRFDLDEVSAETVRQEIDAYQDAWLKHAEFVREWNEDPPKHPSFEKLLDFVDDIIDSGRV